MPLYPPPAVAGTNFSLNATSSSVSLSAGAGIGIGQAASTITFSASVQTVSKSLTALGNTTISSVGTLANLLNISGAGIVSVGVGAQSMTISASTAASANVVSAFGTGIATSTGTIVLAAGANITLNTGASSITIVGPTVPAATNFSLNASSSSVSLVAGANITLNSGASSITIVGGAGAAAGTNTFGAGATSLITSAANVFFAVAGQNLVVAVTTAGNQMTVQHSLSSNALSNVTALNGSSGSISLVAGANITLNTGLRSITIVGPAVATSAVASIYATENQPLEMVVDPISTSTGFAGDAWFNFGMFLDRIYVPAPMNLTEIDVGMSISFPNTSDGAGTLSRSMIIYSFVNSTSISSLLSISGTSSWNTGTSTAGISSSLTQFQGGWSSPLIQPMTFPVTTLAQGAYVVGQHFKASFTGGVWTHALYGIRPLGTVIASAATNLTSATVGALSSAGLAAGSGVTGVSHYASPVVWVAGGGTAANAAGTVVMRVSAGAAASTYSNSKFDITGSNSLAASFYFAQSANLTANTFFISSLGTVAGSIYTGSTSIGAVTNVALGALKSSTMAQASNNVLGSVGTNSATTTLHLPFQGGRYATAFPLGNIALTDPTLTMSGTAMLQPWFRLVGS